MYFGGINGWVVLKLTFGYLFSVKKKKRKNFAHMSVCKESNLFISFPINVN